MQLHQVLDDGQPEAQTTEAALRTRVLLPKPVEHVRQELRRDAGAGVVNHDRRLGAGALQPQLHAARLRRELDGVRQQVPDDLLQAIGVARDGADALVDDRVDADLLRVGRRRHGFDRLAHDIWQADLLDVEPERAAVEPSHVQQVFDQPGLRAGVPLDRLDG